MLRLKNIKRIHKQRKKAKRVDYHFISDFINKIKLAKLKHNHETFSIGFKGYSVHFSNKMKMFISNYDNYGGKCKCVYCGLEATYVVIDKLPEQKSVSVNMYTVCKTTKTEIMFNIDHIKPKSKGGNNNSDNYQLTCETCNSIKSDKIDFQIELPEIILDFTIPSFISKIKKLIYA